jgi:hypothetical protein
MDETDTLRRSLLAALPALVLAPDAATALPAERTQPESFKVVLENDHVRVLEYHSRPGLGVCGSGLHSHPAHLSVVLSGGKVRIRTPDGKVTTTPEAPPGLVFWSEAETHETENVSGRDMRSLIIELVPQRTA